MLFRRHLVKDRVSVRVGVGVRVRYGGAIVIFEGRRAGVRVGRMS